ncbi:SPFH domain-containing protein [Mesoterricola silvestris]|uniref:Protein QmcA n=1 Tax=Mesoterricola silvestris TaxID=2927979 RepID=A0AA48GIS5_9BACT|nr:SPFH domain-containing protein [Mesoterricola silvestris]BDU73736.1 paraslipin [Mesoterricola silvestris]
MPHPFLLFGAFLVLVLAIRSLRIIRPYQKGVVETLGRYTAPPRAPGLVFVMPFVQRLEMVDSREQVIEVPPQEVITKDNAAVTVDAVIYFRITDPVRVIYNISNFSYAAVKLAQTNLRNIVGEMELDQTLTGREKINTQLRLVLDEATDEWGVKVVRVEIQKIEPPTDITNAMSKQMKAEREKRAAILESEGFKQSAILKAEGERESQVLRAEGDRQGAIIRAEGQAQAVRVLAEAERFRIETVFNAIHAGNPDAGLLALRSLETLEKVADGKATKIFLPSDLGAALSSLGAVGELFRKDPEPPPEPAPAPPRAPAPAPVRRGIVGS